MPAVPDRHRLALIMHSLVLLLVGAYAAMIAAAYAFSAPVNLNLTIAGHSCPEVTARYEQQSWISEPKTVSQPLALEDHATSHAIEIPPSIKTVYLDLCREGSVEVSQINLTSATGVINYALKPGDLHCYGCQFSQQPGNYLAINPTSPQSSFVIANLHHKIPYLLPAINRPQRYMPLLIFGAIAATLLIPALRSKQDLHLMLQAGSLFSYAVWRWNRLRTLFPPPLIGSQKIVALSHMNGTPLKADTLIFTLTLASLPLLAVTHLFLTRYANKKPSFRYVITYGLIVLILVALESIT